MTRENQVQDFLFSNKEDALLAQSEAQKIEKLEEKMNYEDIDLVYKVYNKCIEARTFKTPVGFAFMQKLKKILEENYLTPGDVVPIPLYSSFDMQSKKNEFEPVKKKVQTTPKEEITAKDKLKWSLILNAVFLLMIIAMFYITTTGKNPNILNYENAIINKYANWEEELNDREALIRQKEAQLEDSSQF